MLEVGNKIEDVEVVARLKSGGMAALYLGRRGGAGGFSKDLAIKVIHTHLATDNSFVEMFVDEARLSARIDHPNVVRVEALKQYEESYCLLMEFVHGCSLSQLMGTLKKRDKRFSPELAVAIAIRVADGLHAAHELLNPDGSAAGVVHRDVSPANVLVGYRGDVKLIDFGIAKATQRLHHTEAAGLKGKIAYMSPEQAFGRHVDRRTDVYALGIVLWEMLTMRRLFKADNDLMLLDMVREPKVVPPGAIVPDLPPALDRVVLEALAPDRERRPATARDLRYRLLDALPSAAAIDPLQISAVVCDVMAEKILEDREILSVSSFNSLPSGSEDSITVSRLLRPAASSVEIAVDHLGHSAEVLAQGFGHVQTEHREAPPTLLPHDSAMTPASLTGASSHRKLLPMVLGAAAALGLAAGGVAGLTFMMLSGEESTAQASENGTGALPNGPRRDEVASPPPNRPMVANAEAEGGSGLGEASEANAPDARSDATLDGTDDRRDIGEAAPNDSVEVDEEEGSSIRADRRALARAARARRLRRQREERQARERARREREAARSEGAGRTRSERRGPTGIIAGEAPF